MGYLDSSDCLGLYLELKRRINVDHLIQITLGRNTGTFLVYGFTNLIALIAYELTEGYIIKNILVPMLGFFA